ncbi:tRNA-uridine aminocarboxypropyltransferase [Noviherbaspirillum sp. 1P10PC]|uniref:tRNA-uridine aminocarboxypropyltransferase n=1 Tax=Noviherbaspirillum sp. 1P10PC TaxID=3132292 RepID=UPI00399F4DC3
MSSAPSRPVCPTCLRPARACICAWAMPTANQVDLLLLQHPLETGHAKNSLTLLRLSLARYAVAVGEAFAPAQLQQLLDGPEPGKTQPVLLYPGAPDTPSFLPDPDGPPPRLVVLDATWRKSRKMLALNPALQALPRLSLSAPPPSQYRIRKAHKPGQLSTLEAVCHALAQLEGDAARYRPLLQAFDGFVAQQLAFRDTAD